MKWPQGGAGSASDDELGDTAMPCLRAAGRARRTGEITGGGLPRVSHVRLQPELWVPTVARHPPYRPPSTWRDEL